MVKLIQNSFASGQLDADLMGRQDLERYANGATLLKNFTLLRKRGGISKRPGFDRLRRLNSENVRLVPFAYKKNNGFVLVFTDGRIEAVRTTKIEGDESQFVETFLIDGANGVYNSEQIKTLDYQQCGDVIFIAHQSKPPAKIEHSLDINGKDVFTYEVIDFKFKTQGIPNITGSTVKRKAFQALGAGNKTEVYKATAVYDGQESYPCTAYSNEGLKDNATKWSGTTYYLPWSDSQTITLDISVPRRIVGSVTVYPEEIRVYRKDFDYFGLVGVIDINNQAKKVGFTKETSGNTITLTPTGGVKVKEGFVDFILGEVKVDYSENNTVATISFNGWQATTASIGTATIELPDSSAVQSVTVTKEQDEEDDHFIGRVNDAKSIFEEAIPFNREFRIGYSFSGEQASVNLTFDKTANVGTIELNKYEVETTVSFVDKYYSPKSEITPPERDENEVFSKEGDYPGTVSLSQQRLVWASSRNDPAKVWLSQVGDFYNYSVHEVMNSDDAIEFIVPVTRFARINFIAEMRKLLMFNSSSEWMVDSSSSTSGITYQTIQAYPQSYSGSSDMLKPLICGNAIIFASRSCQEVRRFAWDLSNDGFAGKDISILSSSIFRDNRIVDWTYQQAPSNMIWCVLSDGTMASLTYMEEQDVMCWMTHEVGGRGKVLSIATTYSMSPHLDELKTPTERGAEYDNATNDEVFAAVKRADGVWLERMRIEPKTNDSVYHALCLDGLRICNQASARAPLKLDGQVYFKEDGTSVTASAAQDLYEEGETVYEGWPFEAKFVSVYPAIGKSVGLGQFDIKNITSCGFRLFHAKGGEVAANGCDKFEPIRYTDGADKAMKIENGRVKFTEVDSTNIKPFGLNTRDGRVVVRQSEPWPFGILMFELDVAVEEERG